MKLDFLRNLITAGALAQVLIGPNGQTYSINQNPMGEIITNMQTMESNSIINNPMGYTVVPSNGGMPQNYVVSPAMGPNEYVPVPLPGSGSQDFSYGESGEYGE